jgi:hypothetical protein
VIGTKNNNNNNSINCRKCMRMFENILTIMRYRESVTSKEITVCYNIFISV